MLAHWAGRLGADASNNAAANATWSNDIDGFLNTRLIQGRFATS